MYILLNIKDGEKASAAITLLIKNGYTSMITGEEISEICPECSRRTGEKDETSSIPPVPQTETEDINLDWLKECMSQGSSAQAMPRQKKPASVPIYLKPQVEQDSLPLFEVEVKEEHREEIAKDTNKTPGTKEVIPNPLKRSVKRRRAESKDQGLSCAYCKGFITWGGSTPVANIERHLKLHASKSQFSCSMCSYTCGRRYMAKAHIENRHPPHVAGNDAVIIDHLSELEEEYAQLWLHCFPHLDIAQYKAKQKEFGEKKRKFEYSLLPKRAENEKRATDQDEREEASSSKQKEVFDLLLGLTQ